MPNALLKTVSKDIPAGIVVFLVALPLCIAIAVASGATPFSGLIAGIVGGIVVGALSNSHLSVSGPAAGLAILVSGCIDTLGGLENYGVFLCAVIIAGVIQLFLGLAKLGAIANFIPTSVIKGMLTSIGILIITKQMPHVFGKDRDNSGNIVEFLPLGGGDYIGSFAPVASIEASVLLISAFAIFVMVLWNRSVLKVKLPFIPPAFVAVLFGVLINRLWILTNSKLKIVEPEHLIQLPIAKNPGDFFGFFTVPNFSGFFNGTIIVYGIIIAIIASLETLLSIEAIDELDPERRVTNTNKELLAQGAGNILSGLIGGLPITSVIIRSSANLNAGAKSKLATIFHACLLLITVIFIPEILCMIPKGVLAAILILTGWKLAKPSVFKSFWNAGKYQFIPFIVTVSSIIFIDLFNVIPLLTGKGLIIGVLIGLMTAMVAILHGNLKNSFYFHKENYHDGDLITFHLSEEVSFLNKASIRESLDHLPASAKVIIDASRTKYIDYDVLTIIKEFRDIKAPLKNIQLSLKGFREKYNIINTEFIKING